MPESLKREIDSGFTKCCPQSCYNQARRVSIARQKALWCCNGNRASVCRWIASWLAS